jgi:hypothetical protein
MWPSESVTPRIRDKGTYSDISRGTLAWDIADCLHERRRTGKTLRSRGIEARVACDTRILQHQGAAFVPISFRVNQIRMKIEEVSNQGTETGVYTCTCLPAHRKRPCYRKEDTR